MDEPDTRPFDDRPVDEYGFFKDTKTSKLPLPACTSLLLKKWSDILAQPSIQNTRDTKLLCRKGIPRLIRGEAWVHLTASRNIIYQDVLPIHIQTHALIFEVIECDIERCYPGTNN